MSYTNSQLLVFASNFEKMTLESLGKKAKEKEEKKKFPFWLKKKKEDSNSAKDKLDPKAEVRNRGTVCVPAEHAKDKKDHFPINDEKQGRNALAQVAKYTATPPWYEGSLSALQALVKKKVHAKYPSIGKEKKKSAYYETVINKLGQTPSGFNERSVPKNLNPTDPNKFYWYNDPNMIGGGVLPDFNPDAPGADPSQRSYNNPKTMNESIPAQAPGGWSGSNYSKWEAQKKKQTTTPTQQAPAKNYGSSSDQAMMQLVQKYLNNEGLNAGPADGKAGPLTQAAIKRYQNSLGAPITPTGYLDGPTWQSMYAAMKAKGLIQTAPSVNGV